MVLAFVLKFCDNVLYLWPTIAVVFLHWLHLGTCLLSASIHHFEHISGLIRIEATPPPPPRLFQLRSELTMFQPWSEQCTVWCEHFHHKTCFIHDQTNDVSAWCKHNFKGVCFQDTLVLIKQSNNPLWKKKMETGTVTHSSCHKNLNIVYKNLQNCSEIFKARLQCP